MALTTLDQMKSEINDHWEQFADNPYAEDLLHEFADSACPIYYGDIIAEWQEMPSEFNDSWQEISDADWVITANITQLMSVDLCNYYNDLARRAYEELLEEYEAENA